MLKILITIVLIFAYHFLQFRINNIVKLNLLSVYFNMVNIIYIEWHPAALPCHIQFHVAKLYQDYNIKGISLFSTLLTLLSGLCHMTHDWDSKASGPTTGTCWASSTPARTPWRVTSRALARGTSLGWWGTGWTQLTDTTWTSSGTLIDR